MQKDLSLSDFARTRIEVFRVERLLESCDDDEELARDVVADFLTTAPPVLARLACAVAEGSVVHARLEAHSLKGSAQTLGLEALALVSLDMEEAAKRGEMSQAPGFLARIEGEFRRALPWLEDYLHGENGQDRQAA